jgi:hypothetical protein
MDNLDTSITVEGAISPASRKKLDEMGYVVIPGAIGSGELPRITTAYDAHVASASPDDIKLGRSTTRLDLINGGPELDSLYILPSLLGACRHVIGQPMKLSSYHLRTLHPRTGAQGLHIDFKPGEEIFPLAGFIFMIDDFRSDNGATGFVPGSHRWPLRPDSSTDDAASLYKNRVKAAYGRAGSLIVFHGSAWHGHLANLTDVRRRSIQGAFIPRDAVSAVDFQHRIEPDARRRMNPLASYLLAI